jgi:hypothetical protein
VAGRTVDDQAGTDSRTRDALAYPEVAASARGGRALRAALLVDAQTQGD